MARFLVDLSDTSTEVIDDADAYAQEGPLTTFFALADGRQVIDSWSVRQASFRTADIVAVRRAPAATAALVEPEQLTLDTPTLLRTA
ncbi:MAG: hypothetical protein ACRBI6_21530 [Acidimicrobiales bacterium]